MQSSLVHVPCKSGSPHGVFGCVQLLAEGAVLAACARAVLAATAKMMRTSTSAGIDPGNRCFIRLSFLAVEVPISPSEAGATSSSGLRKSALPQIQHT